MPPLHQFALSALIAAAGALVLLAPAAAPGGPGTPAGAAAAPRAPAPAPLAVVAEPPARAVRVERHVALGHLEPGLAAEVTARAGGRVAAVLARPGAQLAAGDPVLALEDRDERLALARADLALAEAEAALARLAALAATGAAPPAQTEAARAARDRAALDREAAAQALAERILRAPVAGRPGLIRAQPGEVLAPGAAVAAIAADDSLRVRFTLSERAAAAVAPGDRVAVRAVMLDGPARPAEVVAIDGRIDPETGLMPAEAVLAGPAPGLRPGLRVAVEFERAHETLPAVDPLAVGWGAGGPFVWTIRDGRAARLAVEIAARQGDRLLLRAAFAPGDLVVVEGMQALREGAPVQPAPPPAVPAPAIELVRRGDRP